MLFQRVSLSQKMALSVFTSSLRSPTHTDRVDVSLGTLFFFLLPHRAGQDPDTELFCGEVTSYKFLRQSSRFTVTQAVAKLNNLWSNNP